jgi:hypothetical protein
LVDKFAVYGIGSKVPFVNFEACQRLDRQDILLETPYEGANNPLFYIPLEVIEAADYANPDIALSALALFIDNSPLIRNKQTVEWLDVFLEFGVTEKDYYDWLAGEKSAMDNINLLPYFNLVKESELREVFSGGISEARSKALKVISEVKQTASPDAYPLLQQVLRVFFPHDLIKIEEV